MRLGFLLLFFSIQCAAQSPDWTLGERYKSPLIFGNVPIILGTHNGETYLLRIEGMRPNPTKIEQMSESNSFGALSAVPSYGIIGDDEGMFNLQNYTNVDFTNLLSFVNVVLEKYDSSFNRVYTNKLITKDDKSVLKIIKVALVDGKLLKFYTKYNSKTYTTDSYVVEIDTKTGIEFANATLLDQFTYKSTRNNASTNTFVYAVNQDSSLIVQRFHEVKPTAPSESDYFMYLRWMDKSGQSIASLKLKIGIPQKRYSMKNWWVAKDSTVFILMRVLANGSSQNPNTALYGYLLLTTHPSSPEFTFSDIVLNEGSFIDIRGNLTPEGNLTLSGLYSLRSVSNTSGVYTFRFNTRGEKLSSFQYPLSNDLVERINKEEQKDTSDALNKVEKDFDDITSNLFGASDPKNETPKVSRYHLRKFFETDSTEIFIAEKYYIVNIPKFTTFSSSGSQHTGVGNDFGMHQLNSSEYVGQIYSYFYEDIVVLKYNRDGSLLWYNHIPKNQRTTNDGGFFSSMMSSMDNGSLNIFFNELENDSVERINNAVQTLGMVSGNSYGTLLTYMLPYKTVQVSISTDGNLSRKELFFSRDQKVALAPRISFASTGRIIGYFSALDEFSLGSIRY